MERNPKYKERKEKIKKKRKRFILLIIGIIIIFFVVFKTKIFSIGEIQVLGNSRIEKEEIINTSKIEVGNNLFKVNTRKVEDHIKTLPYIKEIDVKKKLPNRLVIEVIEREEKAQTFINGSYLIIDSTGRILNALPEKREDIPIIIHLETKHEKIGGNIFEGTEFTEFREFLENMNQLNIADGMNEIDLAMKDEITISMNSGIVIDFGDLNSVKYKLKLLNEILIDIESKGIDCKRIVMDKGEYPIIITND